MRKIGFLVAVLGLCAIAQAGVVLNSFECTFDDDPLGENHEWSYDYATDTLTLAETYVLVGTDSVNMAVETDDDPMVHIIKTVTNDNGHDWTSYTLTLGDADPAVYFLDTASSNVYTSAVLNGNVITYSGATVAVGETVDLEFDIMIDTGGTFSWCITQNPIPEPATMAMLGLGALLLRRKK